MHFFEASSFCSFVHACGIENENVANYDVHIENSVKVASQKGKRFNLAFLYHTYVCKLKFVTSSSQWLILYQAKKFPLQIFYACGILLPFSHLQINTKQFKKWRVKKVQEFPNEEILLQFLRVQNNHLNLHLKPNTFNTRGGVAIMTTTRRFLWQTLAKSRSISSA